MRILFLAHRLPYPPNKGEKIRAFWELRALSEHNDVDLFCFYVEKDEKKSISDIRNYCRSCYAEQLSPLSARSRALTALLRKKAFSPAFFRSPEMARHVSHALSSRSYDAVFVFGSAMAQYAEHWSNGIKVLDLVDVDSDKWFQYSNQKGGLLRSLWKREGKQLAEYERRLVSSFDHTLICTEAEAQLLRSIAPIGAIHTFENCLDLDFYDPESTVIPDSLRTLQPYVVFTGSMNYFPNIDAVEYFVREIFPFVRAQVPKLSLVVAGRNPVPEVKALCKQAGVHITGTVADIRPYLKGAAAAIAPMRVARGVQNKILEALAMNTSVVASTKSAAALSPQLRAMVEAVPNAQAFADRLIDILRQPSRKRPDSRSVLQDYFDSLNLQFRFVSFFQGTAMARANTDGRIAVAI